MTNHPHFVYDIINSCKTGAATNIIYGLSFGYFFNLLPIIVISSIGFLSYFWLGSYGVGLISIGFLTLSPNYICITTFYSVCDNCSFISYINQMH